MPETEIYKDYILSPGIQMPSYGIREINIYENQEQYELGNSVHSADSIESAKAWVDGSVGIPDSMSLIPKEAIPFIEEAFDKSKLSGYEYGVTLTSNPRLFGGEYYYGIRVPEPGIPHFHIHPGESYRAPFPSWTDVGEAERSKRPFICIGYEKGGWRYIKCYDTSKTWRSYRAVRFGKVKTREELERQ